MSEISCRICTTPFSTAVLPHHREMGDPVLLHLEGPGLKCLRLFGLSGVKWTGKGAFLRVKAGSPAEKAGLS